MNSRIKIINQMITNTILPDVWLKGTVIKGQGRGKKLGFPTINLQLGQALNLRSGVYLCKIKIGNNNYQGLLFYGPQSTFSNNDISCELLLTKHISGIYLGLTVLFKPMNYLREAKRFPSAASLVAQIHKDLEFVQ